MHFHAHAREGFFVLILVISVIVLLATRRDPS